MIIRDLRGCIMGRGVILVKIPVLVVHRWIDHFLLTRSWKAFKTFLYNSCWSIWSWNIKSTCKSLISFCPREMELLQFIDRRSASGFFRKYLARYISFHFLSKVKEHFNITQDTGANVSSNFPVFKLKCTLPHRRPHYEVASFL